jgi:hypothetical protein
MSNRRPASWLYPKPKEIEKLAARMRSPAPAAPDPGPGGAPPEAWWDSVFGDPRVTGERFETGDRSGQRFETSGKNLRLGDIRREVLRVECLRCFRIVEIQRLDAIKLYGPQAVWKEVGAHLLDNGCQHRTGSRDEDGCWPRF